MLEKNIRLGIELLENEFGEKRVKQAVDAVKKFSVEVPSWVFGNFGGGRFGEYTPPGGARNIQEKLDDAALVNAITGATPRVATHILWDFSKDSREGDFEIAKAVKREAKQRGLDLGAVNPTYFLSGSLRGSLSSDDRSVRKRYLEQTVLGGKIADELGNGLLTLWFPDGSAYPGQVELRKAYRTLKDSLKEARARVPKGVKILIEYKVFEPGTYSTTVASFGAAALLAAGAGKNTGVLVDLGHHHHGTNIEQIVALLIEEGVPGGFHFNTRYSADDDHAVEPNPENARIFYELVSGDALFSGAKGRNWPCMIDQCCGRENRMHAVLHSVDSLQQSLAKAMLVDSERIAALQEKDEVIKANRVFNDAMINADVRPVVARARVEKGLPVNLIGEYEARKYQEKIESKRSR